MATAQEKSLKDNKAAVELQMKQSKKYKSFTTYLRNIFKESLITSLPEIAGSKSWIKRLVKIVVFVLCVVGFIVQTRSFLMIYWLYPTAVNIEVSYPFQVTQPAITICNRNLYRRSAYCEVNRGYCSWYSEKLFCDTFKRSCPDNDEVFNGAPFVDTYVNKETQWDVAFNYAHTDAIILQCLKTIEGQEIPCSKPYYQVPFITAEGAPNLCYTIESQWGKPDAKPDIYPNTFSFTVILDLQPEEYTVPTAPVTVQIGVHDRRMLLSPYSEGYLLSGGNVYNAYISMSEKELLSAPYDTDCTDYVTLWKKRNGTGPLNEMMCVEECKLITLKENGTCIDRNIAYPHTDPLCPSKVFSVTKGIVEKCTKECGQACRDTSYELRIEPTNNYDSICDTEWCKTRLVQIDVYFKRFRVTKFKYQPKFESVEMFSYIGGYMGMWLGLSLISLFDLFETFLQIFYFPFGKYYWQSKKKKGRFARKALKIAENRLFMRRRFDRY